MNTITRTASQMKIGDRFTFNGEPYTVWGTESDSSWNGWKMIMATNDYTGITYRFRNDTYKIA